VPLSGKALNAIEKARFSARAVRRCYTGRGMIEEHPRKGRIQRAERSCSTKDAPIELRAKGVRIGWLD
jgi:hypothetical protein